ncbi:PREDICTED: uclacyanin-2-like [Camelina sativa]|uniref:Uclacyanin-2-like n=1 Tax=Camelina sativa TaxID=90675 RepID=A0ABM0YVC3_CAMSA|nr:PREDICTED: uclacyanin-2-like [Camelina sativa]
MATNGLSEMAAAILLLVMAIVPATVAVTYTVGDESQWASGVDYTAWVIGKTFRVGDTLEFKYGPSHSVDVVNKAGYDDCDGSSASENFSDGDTKIELKTVGTKYFVCPTPGHCISGMKLAIPVIAAASSPPTPTSPSPSLSAAPPPISKEDSQPSDGTHVADSVTPPPPPPSPPPPPPSSSGASSGLVSYVMVGMSLVLACNNVLILLG